jgi:methionine sulfoxide reductase catalytic subunit
VLIKSIRPWDLPEAKATPEHVFLDRRKFIAASGMTAAIGLAGLGGIDTAAAQDADPTADLYPAKRNDAYKLERALTPEEVNLQYNNFYEFGSQKDIAKHAQQLKTRPWEVRIDGEVEQAFTIGIDDLIRKMALEERLYRHRCVEAWSMTIPWTGFAMKDLVALAKPNSNAKYIRMETFLDQAMAPGQRQVWYPWPYVEGVTMEEAANDLAFLVTGAYGKPAAKQFGAPLRLALPWKYGFKSIKSIVRFEFTTERPKSFWEEVQSSEYGFWANVNPEVPHPRWSQASERVLGTSETVPTKLFNGYGEQVAHLYKDMDPKDLYH